MDQVVWDYYLSSCMAWFRIRESLSNWLDTEWKLRIVAVRKDSQLQEGLIFGTSEILDLMANRKAYEVDRQAQLPVHFLVSSDTFLQFQHMFFLIFGLRRNWKKCRQFLPSPPGVTGASAPARSCRPRGDHGGSGTPDAGEAR